MFKRSVRAFRLVRASVDDVESVLPSFLNRGHPIELDVLDRHCVAVRVSVMPELGLLSSEAGILSLPVSWEPVGHKHLLPAFTGQLGALGLSGGGSYLELSGTYRPPLGVVGLLIDSIKANELAARALDGLLTEIGQAIDRAVQTRREAGALRPATYPEDFRSRHM